MFIYVLTTKCLQKRTNMGLLNDFPVEILSLIFQETWELYQPDALQSDKSDPRRIFPFNTATVCALWLNILKSQPQYWKCVTFDVADDPTPFLDTLGLYAGGGLGLDVRIISSRKSSATELQEKSRVEKIYTRLQPCLFICGTIAFDLTFQSSLPSSADILTHCHPLLSSLSLRCTVHNCDDDSLEIKIDTNKISRHEGFLHPVFPALRRLSLTGYSFVELYQLGEEWARISDDSYPESSLHISVNHFKCHKRGHGDANGSRSLDAFLKTIALGTRYKIFELVLTDISIDYRHTTDYYPPSMPFTTIKFKDVSRKFLSAFFASFSAPHSRQSLRKMHLQGCSIPHIPNGAWSHTDMLIITHTPFRQAHSYSSSVTERLDDSLYNAVSAFQPENLRLRSCEELNDAFFDWLCDEVGDYSGLGLKSIDVKHCRGFTARALCDFVQYRNAQSTDSDDEAIPPIRALYVDGGRNALLAKADAQWFQAAGEDIHVEWTVSDPGEVGGNYLSSFHTSSG